MADDPRPEWRCVCIGFGDRPEPYRGRCHERPTQEDQLCNHCRRVCTSEPGWQTVPLLTPCSSTATEEVPF